MHVYTRSVSAKDSVLVMTSKNSQRPREFTRKKWRNWNTNKEVRSWLLVSITIHYTKLLFRWAFYWWFYYCTRHGTRRLPLSYSEHCIKAAELNTFLHCAAIEHSYRDGWYCTSELLTNAQTDWHATWHGSWTGSSGFFLRFFWKLGPWTAGGLKTYAFTLPHKSLSDTVPAENKYYT